MPNRHAKYEDCGLKESKLIGRTSFFINQGPCDLDLWPGNLKIYRDHLLIMTNLDTKYEDYWKRNLKLLGGQAFFSQNPCDLDLWPGDLKIDTGHLLIMTYLHAKIWRLLIKGIFSYWAGKLF
jgi:hypothetical protein